LALVLTGAWSGDGSGIEDHCKFAAKYSKAQRAAHEADADVGMGNLIDANVVLKRALMEFDYIDPHVLDDTGMHLVLADPAERKGDLKLAVTIRRRILGERMDMYKVGHPTPCPAH
jgi:hypothetical protein